MVNLYLMMKKELTVPLMERALRGGIHNDVYVSGKSKQYLAEIRELMNVFAPTGDDFRHGMWIEVPRGKPGDWSSFKSMKDFGDVETRKEYLKLWKEYYPMQSQWFYLSVSHYDGHNFLHITDNDLNQRLFRDDGKESSWDSNDWFLGPLLAFLKKRIPGISQDIEAYNAYVEKNLPYRLRDGHIPRKDLDRIVPWQRRIPKQLKKGKQVLRECIVNQDIYERLKAGETVVEYPSFYRPPMEEMTIRLYSKYFRVAHTRFRELSEQSLGRSKERARRKQERLADEHLDDLAYYKRNQLGRHGEITEETDLDSVDAFKEMAFDHYGELGFSRMDVHATDYYTPGKWVISFCLSYSAYIDDFVDIAVALYESGCPLVIQDAKKILNALEENDNVLLTPYTFHDYFCHHEEGSVFSLPFECYLDTPDHLTQAQYNEIVSLADWDKEGTLKLDKTLPLEDSIYDLVRQYGISQPMTVYGILEVLTHEEGWLHGIMHKDGGLYCYLIKHKPEKIRIEDSETIFHSCNDAVYHALTRYLHNKHV